MSENACQWTWTCCQRDGRGETMHRESSDYFSARLSVHKGRGAWCCRHDGTMGGLNTEGVFDARNLGMCMCVLKGTCCWRSGSGGNLTNGGYKMVSMGDMMTGYVKKEHGPPTQRQCTGATSNISTTELGGVKNNEHLQHKVLAHKKN